MAERKWVELEGGKRYECRWESIFSWQPAEGVVEKTPGGAFQAYALGRYLGVAGSLSDAMKLVEAEFSD